MSHDEMALEEEFARVPLKRATLKRLYGYLHPQRRPILLALVLEVIWVFSMLLEVYLMRRAVDGPLADHDAAGMWLMGGFLAANIAFRVALTIAATDSTENPVLMTFGLVNHQPPK